MIPQAKSLRAVTSNVAAGYRGEGASPVRRVLATRARPKPHSDGPSWLTLIAQARDSVWSVDLFRVEST
jgi:hypothetical protein